MTKVLSATGYACFSPAGEIAWDTIRETREKSLKCLIGDGDDPANWTWQELQKKGWRCLPLQTKAIERGPFVSSSDRHWIVKRVSPYGPNEFRPHFYWRHATEALANAEALRLARTSPGIRFAVYASGGSAKIDKDSPKL